MINKQILTLMTICSLCFVGCGSSGNTKQDFNNDKYTKDIENLDISIKNIPSEQNPLNISAEIVNNTDHNILLPNTNAMIFQSFSIIEDGNRVSYIGPFTFPGGGGTVIQSGTSLYDKNINISEFYAVTKGTHRYEITLSLLDVDNSNTLEFDATLLKDGGSDHN